MVDGGLVGGELFVVFNIRKAFEERVSEQMEVRNECEGVDEWPSHPRICLSLPLLSSLGHFHFPTLKELAGFSSFICMT